MEKEHHISRGISSKDIQGFSSGVIIGGGLGYLIFGPLGSAIGTTAGAVMGPMLARWYYRKFLEGNQPTPGVK